MYDMSKYYMLKTYIKYKKHNFITLPISNKIIILSLMIKNWRKNYCLQLFFNNLYRCY